MTAVFTDFFRTLLYNSLDRVDPLDPATNLFSPPKPVHWTYFRFHTAFTDSNDSRYTGIKTVSDLAGRAGWSAASTPNSATASVGATTSGTSTYVVANNKFNMGGGWVTSTVTAAALVLEGTYTIGAGNVTDPIIYITDTPFPGGEVMRVTDGLIARPVSALAGNRSLFSWPIWSTGQTATIPIEGSVAVTLGAPDFEASYTHHAWLYPQRINMIANPSFETLAPGTNHWRSNGTLSAPQGTPSVPVAPGGSASNTHYGRVTGTAPVVLESNLFPLFHRAAVEDKWTIQAMVRGTGKLRVGLVGWDPTFLAATTDWGDRGDYIEEWTLPSSGFLHVQALRNSYESTTGLVRFESSGGTLEIDNVLCEPDWLKDWRYFDGDSTFGARDDHSWYGGKSRQGKTYSCFYNHRRAVIGRLFAWDIEADDFTITDEEVEAQGFVYKWVPAGVRVAAHLDVLWQEDIQEVVPDNAGTPVTPFNGPAYLNPTIGTVSTPDTADMTLNSKFRVTVQAWLKALPTSGFPNLINKTGVGGANREYLLYVSPSIMAWSTANQALNANVDGGFSGPMPSTDVTHTFGFEVTPGSTAFVQIVDGVRTNGAVGVAPAFPDSAAVVRIGDSLLTSTRIYSAQLEAINRATVTLPGTVGAYLSTPDAAPLDITGDIEMVVRIAPTTWRPAVNMEILSKAGLPTNQQSYRFLLTPSGAFSVGVSVDGTNYVFNNSTAVPNDGLARWLKFTRVAATGAITLSLAADSPNEPTSWTNVGTGTVASGNIFSSTAALWLGQLNFGAGTYPFSGRIQRAILRSTIGAPAAVFDYNENNAGSLVTASTFLATTGQTMTVNGAVAVAPVADSLIWRFDAAEYPGNNVTSYVDPRGRTWTLTAAGAISPLVENGINDHW